MKITNEIANEVLLDPVNFKLILANHHLEKIPSTIPQNLNYDHFFYESHIESFLLFCNMTIDTVAFEINDHFKWFNVDEEISIYDIKKRVKNSSNKDEQKISDIIEKYFSDPKPINEVSNDREYKIFQKHDSFKNTPNYFIDLINEDEVYTKKGWDLYRSMLWLLRELRNTVAHKPLLGRGIIVSDRSRVTMLIFARLRKSKIPTLYRGFDNPQLFCQKCYDDLISFVEDIRMNVPRSNSSKHYKNKLEFDL